MCFCAVRVRLKSVTNIQKITKSMKMVSAAKYAKAERELRPARPFGSGAKGVCFFFKQFYFMLRGLTTDVCVYCFNANNTEV